MQMQPIPPLGPLVAGAKETHTNSGENFLDSLQSAHSKSDTVSSEQPERMTVQQDDDYATAPASISDKTTATPEQSEKKSNDHLESAAIDEQSTVSAEKLSTADMMPADGLAGPAATQIQGMPAMLPGHNNDAAIMADIAASDIMQQIGVETTDQNSVSGLQQSAGLLQTAAQHIVPQQVDFDAVPTNSPILSQTMVGEVLPDQFLTTPPQDSETILLQAHFKLDMSYSLYEAQDIWDVLIAAAVERVTIEMACGLLDDAPSPNTVRTAVYGLLNNETTLVELEATINALLVARLPKKLLRQALVGATDITEIPYHGQHEEEDENIRRGRAKQGTTHFHCYATLCILKNNKRYSLALTLMRRSDKARDVLKRLLERGQTLGLRLKRLYLDRGFDNNGVVAYLKQQSFPTIIPLTIRGKQGGTRALLKGRKSYKTTYTRASTRYGEQVLTVHVACKYSKGRYGRQGVCHFAYVVIGALKMLPHQVFEEYRRRFGIETSYRLMTPCAPAPPLARSPCACSLSRCRSCC